MRANTLARLLQQGLGHRAAAAWRWCRAAGGVALQEGVAAEGRLRVAIRPPGVAADPTKVERFCQRVDDTLAAGQEIQMEAKGATAVRYVLRALSGGGSSATFEVSWVPVGAEAVGPPPHDTEAPGPRSDGPPPVRALRFVARAGPSWQEHMALGAKGVRRIAVHEALKWMQVAHEVSDALKVVARSGTAAVEVHTPADDDAKCFALVKALAMVASAPGVKVLSTPSISVPPRDVRPRVFVRVEQELQAQATAPEPSGLVFTAVPPGASPEPEKLKRFCSAVRDRLLRGDEILMECRGPHAAAHSMKALCLAEGYVAEFEVRWAEASSRGRRPRSKLGADPAQEGGGGAAEEEEGGDSGSRGDCAAGEGSGEPERARVLQLRAKCGETWGDFNATDFTSSRLLLASSGTEVKKLAWAVAAEVRKNGAVAVHTYSDNAQAVEVVMKALAMVPSVASGDRVVCVPSLGRTQEKRSPVLRLYVRRRPGPPASEPSGGGSSATTATSARPWPRKRPWQRRREERQAAEGAAAAAP